MIRTSSETAPRFDVRVLDTFALWLDGRPVDTSRWQRRPASLIRLLAVSSGHRRPREEVIDLFWPDSDSAAGASNLRYVLHLLRRPFSNGPPPVLSDGSRLMLNPSYAWEIDVERFEDLVRAAGNDAAVLREAARLYVGPPLPDDQYEDWAAPARDRIIGLARDLRLRLGMMAEKNGQWKEAAEWFERMLADDPVDEEALQGLLRTALRAGRRIEALRRFGQFEARLEEEIGVEPEPGTLDLIAAIRANVRAAPLASISELELYTAGSTIDVSYPLQRGELCVGRDRELEQIAASFPSITATTERPRLVLLAGEAGIGKTWVLGEVAQRARNAGIQVLAGGSYEEEGRLPYGPIHDALLDYIRARPELVEANLGDLVPDLSRLVPEVGIQVAVAGSITGDSESMRLRLFTSAAAMLERITAHQPLLLILDDLHWADDATLQLLHFLVRQPSLSRVLVLGTYRPEEMRGISSLGWNGEDGRILTLSLDPLLEDDMQTLVEQRLGDPCDPGLMQLLQSRCEGNPFFTLQVLRLLQSEGYLEREGQGWRKAGDAVAGIPLAVRETIMRRIRSLGARQQEVISTASVLGREVPFAALEALWPGDEEELFGALDNAMETYLLNEAAGGYVFRHPLIREVAYHHLPGHRRRSLHSRAGIALERLYGASAEKEHAAELAFHYLSAGERNSGRAAHYLVLAGDHARDVFAYDDAANHYEKALQLIAPGGDLQREVEIRRRLSESLFHTARFGDALDVLENALVLQRRIGGSEAETILIERVAQVLWKLDRPADAETVLRDALAGGDDLTSSVRARLELTLSRTLSVQGRFRECLEAADRGIALADKGGDVVLLRQGRADRTDALLNLGALNEARAVLEAEVEAAESAGEPHILRFLYNNIGVVAWLQGDLLVSRQRLTRALELARTIGDPLWIMFGLTVLGHTELYLGRWEESRDHLLSAVDLADNMSRSWTVAYPYGCLAELLAHQGKWDEAIPLVQKSIEVAERSHNLEILPHMHAIVAQKDLWNGEARAAFARLVPLLTYESSGRTAEMPAIIEAALVLGDLPQAETLVERGLERAAGGACLFLPDILRLQGRLRCRQRRLAEGQRAFEEGLRVAEEMPNPFAAAQVQLDWGRECARTGNRDEVRSRLSAARAAFESLGATLHLERADRALKSISYDGQPDSPVL